MKRKVELLAPAGNMQCLKAAVHAGADAIYVGGNRFGARAYADNFSEEELCEAVSYAHLFGVKLYLTLNTLLKDDELSAVYDYVRPFYEAGLDGVIVQDFGVVRILKEYFPDLEIHASTQMTVTGTAGAKLLKDMGICRIVPARELSLKEIAGIKAETDIEIETFIHGAMCYSYSGQCLFSSFLGGRSGNRGRCAGPCRLPYDVICNNKNINPKNEQYPISLKDLCSLPLLPKLIESGIDSFKIEGRMKSAEYVAGVTSIYRKYIDLYENTQNSSDFQIDPMDLEHLRNLYLRGDIETGYYEKHNGRSMVTLGKGNYENAVSDYSEYIKEKYVDSDKKIALKGVATFHIGKVAKLEIYDSAKKYTVCVNSQNSVDKAQNRPLEEDDIKKQLLKTGNTPFVFDSIEIIKDEHIFITNKELNELRRAALEAWKNQVVGPYRRQLVSQDEKQCFHDSEQNFKNRNVGALTVSVTTIEQLQGIVELIHEAAIKRIYIPITLLPKLGSKPERILQDLHHQNIEVFISFRTIVRNQTGAHIKEILEKFYIKQEFHKMIDGFLFNNLESLALLREYENSNDKNISECFTGKIKMSDYGLYSFNEQSVGLLEQMGITQLTIPFEWSKHELKKSNNWSVSIPRDVIIYGYIPLMESANCVYKTMKKCQKGQDGPAFYLEDRYKKRFYALADCEFCHNTIFNSVPLSLHKEMGEIKKIKNLDYRLMFTMESAKQMKKLINGFVELVEDNTKYDSTKVNKEKEHVWLNDYTTGHFRKGVL